MLANVVVPPKLQKSVPVGVTVNELWHCIAEPAANDNEDPDSNVVEHPSLKNAVPDTSMKAPDKTRIRENVSMSRYAASKTRSFRSPAMLLPSINRLSKHVTGSEKNAFPLTLVAPLMVTLVEPPIVNVEPVKLAFPTACNKPEIVIVEATTKLQPLLTVMNEPLLKTDVDPDCPSMTAPSAIFRIEPVDMTIDEPPRKPISPVTASPVLSTAFA